MKRIFAALCIITLLLSMAGCGGSGAADQPVSAETPVPSANVAVTPQSFSTGISKINKHGNVILDASFDDMKSWGMEIGDIITVSTTTGFWDMPIGTSFTDVDSGTMVCRFDTEDQAVQLGINSGSFAETVGIAVKETISEDPGYQWTMNVDSVELTLKEKGGYADEYAIRNLERTNERGDYPECSDEDFANFRCISVTGIKPGIVYRSSSPLDARLGRSSYVMTAMEKAGIKVVLNLTDSESEMQAYEGWTDSYYSGCTILNEAMGYDYSSANFAGNVRECVLFINSADGPYLIHCKEGKDRTGVLCAILECYAGASYQEILDDYMLTYKNFYGVEEGTETYSKIVELSFGKILSETLGITEPGTADLQKAAEDYLIGSGLSVDDLQVLREKIMD